MSLMGNKLRSIYQKMPPSFRKSVVSAIISYNKTKNHTLSIFRPVRSNVYKPEQIIKYNRQRQFGPQRRLCYAPYSSMFFSVFGKVAPCYASYHKIHAHYPQQSLKEIWQGEEFGKMREQIKRNDLSDICHFCHIPFMTENYGSMLSSKYDNYHFYREKYPSIMEFELSNNCQLQCIMCNGFLSSGIRSKREKLPAIEQKYDPAFVEQLKEFIPHLKVAEFTGGDPLLIDIYYDIWDCINRLNPNCNLLITTNANTMNERFREVMRNNKRISFNVSIDSLKKEVYESIRIGGNFEKAMQHISVFHDYCRQHKSTLNFLVCPLRKNWKEFPDFIKYANELGISVYFHRVIKPYSHVLWSLPSEELLNIHEYLSKFDFPDKELHQSVNRNNYLNLVAQIHTWYKQSLDREKQRSTPELPFDFMQENEKLLYESLHFFLESNTELHEIYKNDFYAICEKIHHAIGMLPDAINKDAFFEHFLCFPLDESILRLFHSKTDKELAELIKEWMQ